VLWPLPVEAANVQIKNLTIDADKVPTSRGADLAAPFPCLVGARESPIWEVAVPASDHLDVA
jgi:hypothetical protein